MRPHAFPPSHRLHDDRDYARVFQRQQKAAGPHVVALLRPQGKGGGPVGPARLGVMVSTKVAGRAVRRHQLKRWARECFRRELRQRLAGWDLVLLFRRDPPAEGHAALHQEILEQVERARTRAPQPDHRGRGGPPAKGRAAAASPPRRPG